MIQQLFSTPFAKSFFQSPLFAPVVTAPYLHKFPYRVITSTGTFSILATFKIVSICLPAAAAI